MRVRRIFDLYNWPDGVGGFPTSDGRALRFYPSTQSEALVPGVPYEFELTRLPAEGDFASDGVECRVWIADADGRVWTAASRFPAYALLNEMAVAQQNREYYLPLDKPFSSPLLEGVTWTTDSRAVFAVRIEDEDFFVKLKYATLVFDIDVLETDQPERDLRLRAQLREGRAFESLDDLRDVMHPDWLPAISFELGGVESLLRSGGAALNGSGSWEALPFPLPFVFEPTGEASDPQPIVRVS